jgi:hypothetical protein
MASKRLIGIGEGIIKSRDSSANNISNIMDKSINTNSTYETPKRQSARLVINPLYSNKKEPLTIKKLSMEKRYNSLSND